MTTVTIDKLRYEFVYNKQSESMNMSSLAILSPEDDFKANADNLHSAGEMCS